MIQTAVAMAILMLVMSFGVEGLMKYQANSMPYSISAKVSAAVDSVQSATSSYIAQNSACMQNGLTGSGCDLSVANLSPAYLPAFSGISGVNGTVFQTPDGSKIAVTPTGQSTYTISVSPSGVLSSNALKYLASSFPGGSVASGVVAIPETTPSIANMLKANTPAWGTLAPGNGATQNVNGPLNTNGHWIYGPNNNVFTNSDNSGPLGNYSGYICIGWGEVKVTYVSSYSSVMKWTYPYVVSSGNSCNHTTQTWTGPWGWYPVGSSIYGQTNTPAGVSAGWANNASCFSASGCTQELFF